MLPFERPARKPGSASRRSSRPSTSTTGDSSSIGRRRVVIVLGAFTLATGLLAGRAALMTVADGNDFLSFVSGRETAALTLDPPTERGDIISADGQTLATSVDMVRVIATPYQISTPERSATQLAERIPNPSMTDEEELEDITSALSSSEKDGEPVGYSIVGTVEPDVAEEIANLAIPGITFEPSSHRLYADSDLASQTLGYAGDYGQAFGGVEARYDEELALGEDVTLTLDSAVQLQLQDALSDAVEEYDAKNAVGVVMRVDDGSIVAMANAPTYDNNSFSEVAPDEQRNRVIADTYEPGSTLKPITFAAAIESDTLSPNDWFTVPDHITVADRIIHDSLPHRTKLMDPEEILAESSNVGTVQIAQELGAENLHDYLLSFGFGEATGVDLWGEVAGYVPPVPEWSGVSIGNIPIGQGISGTPLQLAAAYATLANGGMRVSPTVVEGGGSGDEHRVISPETSDIVRTMLQGAAENGTGHLAQVPGYTVAGKTGTSQKVDPETGTYGEDYYASFAGFAPATDPKFVTVIVVDEPEASIWGEQVAAPAFSDVMDFTLSYYNVQPDAPGNLDAAAGATP